MKRLLGILLLGVILTNCGTKESIPEISLLMPDSTSYFNIASLPKGKPVLLIYYQPYCQACRAEWKSISDNIEKLRDIQICLITDEPYQDMMSFYKNFGIEGNTNILLGRDTGYSFVSHYKPKAVPYNVFFDRKGNYRGGGTMVLNYQQLDSLLSKM